MIRIRMYSKGDFGYYIIAVIHISVVIPTHRRPQALEACLQSLFADDLTGVSQVILVVHESDDEGHRIALRWERTQARIRIVHTGEATRTSAPNAPKPQCGAAWF
ncbi:MAG: glycosyltransferase [Elusimicrobiota bacterium]